MQRVPACSNRQTWIVQRASARSDRGIEKQVEKSNKELAVRSGGDRRSKACLGGCLGFYHQARGILVEAAASTASSGASVDMRERAERAILLGGGAPARRQGGPESNGHRKTHIRV